MCGIVGVFSGSSDLSADKYGPILSDMSDAILHRGPDDAGLWFDPEKGIGLAHRRLSIIDLTPEGHQPMQSACGRYVVVFNGEIYNFQLLRKELEACGVTRWRGHSDTEVMLAAFAVWGIRRAIDRFNGMFAIAVWDKAEKKLTLVRDRLGKKPLYYARMGNTVVFGSELKALRRFPLWEGTIDRGALTLHLRYGYIPAPSTIYENVKKLQPGSVLEVSSRGGSIEISQTQYWSPADAAECGSANPNLGSGEEILEELEELLLDAVSLRSISDVPLGVFLSGGIDSSLVAALMQARSGGDIRTFSIGFAENNFDEAPFARAISEHLGTDHTEFYVSAQDALDVIPSLPQIYDEPFSDSSQIPTYLVSKLAREHVTVALAGDGGDEGFCGYTRYFQAAKRWEALSRAPLWLRHTAGASLNCVPTSVWKGVSSLIGYQRPAKGASSPFATRVRGLAELLSVASPQDLGLFMMSYWRNPEAIVLGGEEPESAYRRKDVSTKTTSVPEMMMLSDFLQYLPDDILVKVDRASMAVSLEVRAPLLDHRVIEFAWQLPLSVKSADGIGKAPLRQLLAKYVPRELFERPKMGFGVPLESWLRGPLREWSEELLDSTRLKNDGLFHVGKVRERWETHREGGHNWAPHLWNVLTVQAWLDAQR